MKNTTELEIQIKDLHNNLEDRPRVEKVEKKINISKPTEILAMLNLSVEDQTKQIKNGLTL